MIDLKLTALEAEMLSQNAMNKIKGGVTYCVSSCACKYENKGGSSTADNLSANGNAALASNPHTNNEDTSTCKP